MLNPEIVAVQEQETRVMAEGFIDKVNIELTDIKHSFFRIGFLLSEANELGYYKPLGYQNITELAEDKFGFKQSTTYELMQVYELAHSKQAPMQIADKYEKYSKSQLTEFCKIKFATDDFMKIVSPSDTVADIKEAVKNWNKYVAVHSYTPKAGSVLELLEKYREPKAPAAQSVVQGQLPGQTVIDISEVQNVEEFNAVNSFSEYSENSEVSDKPETVAEAPAPAMTDGELIDYCLKEGYGCGELGKFEIYEYYSERQPTRNLFLEYVKQKYGTGGHGGAGEPIYEISYSPSKGVTIERLSGGKLELPWTYITGRISRLIEAGEYLNIKEQTKYIEWKAERDGLVVNVEPAAEPVLPISDKEYDDLIKSLDQLIKPKYSSPKQAPRLNFKNDKARREWLDNFRNWGVWIEVPEVNKTFYRFNFANGAALIVEIGIEYTDCYDGKGRSKENEYKSYSIIDEQRHPKYDSHGISYTLVIQWLSEHREEI